MLSLTQSRVYVSASKQSLDNDRVCNTDNNGSAVKIIKEESLSLSKMQQTI